VPPAGDPATLGGMAQRRTPSAQEAAWLAERVGPDGTMRTKEPTPPPTKADQLQAGQTQTQSGYRGVQMRTPDGRLVMVPHDQVRNAQARGGEVI